MGLETVVHPATSERSIQPSPLARREPVYISDAERERCLSMFAYMASGRRVTVLDRQTSFAVPVATFIDHLPSKQVSDLAAMLTRLTVALAEQAGRADPAALAGFCDDDVCEVVGHFQKLLAYLFSDRRQGGKYLLFDQFDHLLLHQLPVDTAVGITQSQASGEANQAAEGGAQVVVDPVAPVVPVHRDPPTAETDASRATLARRDVSLKGWETRRRKAAAAKRAAARKKSAAAKRRRS